jgi:hypothetical protein
MVSTDAYAIHLNVRITFLIPILSRTPQPYIDSFMLQIIALYLLATQ